MIKCEACHGAHIPNIDMAYSFLRGGFCGHLTNPTPAQLEQARGVLAENFHRTANEGCERIAEVLGLTPCTKIGCCVRSPKRQKEKE